MQSGGRLTLVFKIGVLWVEMTFFRKRDEFFIYIYSEWAQLFNRAASKTLKYASATSLSSLFVSSTAKMHLLPPSLYFLLPPQQPGMREERHNIRLC